MLPGEPCRDKEKDVCREKKKEEKAFCFLFSEAQRELYLLGYFCLKISDAQRWQGGKSFGNKERERAKEREV